MLRPRQASAVSLVSLGKHQGDQHQSPPPLQVNPNTHSTHPKGHMAGTVTCPLLGDTQGLDKQNNVDQGHTQNLPINHTPPNREREERFHKALSPPREYFPPTWTRRGTGPCAANQCQSVGPSLEEEQTHSWYSSPLRVRASSSLTIAHTMLAWDGNMTPSSLSHLSLCDEQPEPGHGRAASSDGESGGGERSPLAAPSAVPSTAFSPPRQSFRDHPSLTLGDHVMTTPHSSERQAPSPTALELPRGPPLLDPQHARTPPDPNSPAIGHPLPPHACSLREKGVKPGATGLGHINHEKGAPRHPRDSPLLKLSARNTTTIGDRMTPGKG